MPEITLYEMKDRIKRYFWFSSDEIRNLIIAIIALGFIVGFNDGNETVNLGFWLYNLISSILIVALTVLVHESAHRIMGLALGLRVFFKMWWYGIFFGLAIAFATNGKLWFLMPGGILVVMMERLRLGKFRYGLNYWPLGWVGWAGPMANLLLALVFRIMDSIPFFAGNLLIAKVINVNLVYGVTNMLFVPPFDGMHMMFSSRLTYAFTFGAMLGMAIMIYARVHPLFTVMGSLLVGAIVWGSYYIGYEESAWDGG